MDADVAARRLLVRARKRAKLTQKQLGARAGVTQPSIAAYETGRRQPTLPTLYRLLGAAGYLPRIRLEQHPGADRAVGPAAWAPLDVVGAARGIRAALRRNDPSEALRWVVQLTVDVRRAPARRADLLVRRPRTTGDPRWDALLAGAVEGICHEAGLKVPAWTVEPERFLDRFWFVIETVLGRPSPALAISAFTDTPPALANRGVFVHAASLESV